MQRQQPGLLLLLWCVALVCACMGSIHARTPAAYAMGQMLREDSCTPIGTSLSPQEACSFVHDHCAHTSIYPYLSLYYCASARVQTLSVSHVLVGLVSLMFVLWLLVLFSVLGLVASDFFCPNLSSIAAKWGMSDSIVGVTLLALGNGFPDVVSTFRAMDKDAGTMAMGEIMGAAVFTVAIVCGSIMVFYSFDIPPVAFVRDVGTYMLAVVLVLSFLRDGTLDLSDGISMLGLYVTYIGVVVMGDLLSERRTAPSTPTPVKTQDHSISIQIPVEHTPLLHDRSESQIDSPSGPRVARHSILSAMRMHDMALHSDAGLLFTPSLAEHVIDPVSRAVWRQSSRTQRVASLSPSASFSNKHSPASPSGPVQDRRMLTRCFTYNSMERVPPTHTHPRTSKTFDEAPASRATASIMCKIMALQDCHNNHLSFSRIVFVALCPSLVNFTHKSWGNRVASVACAPALFVLRLSVPLISPDEYRLHDSLRMLRQTLSDEPADGATRAVELREAVWDEAVAVLETPGPLVKTSERVAADHFLSSIQCVAVPEMMLWSYGASPALLASVGVCGGIVGVFVWRKLRASPDRDSPAQLQRFLVVRSLLGFFMGLLWIVASVDGVLALLRAWGYIYHWSEAILGLTVFALGNSLGDVVTNLSIAQLGHPLMALTACFASPLTNLLLGVGLSTTWLTSTHPSRAPYRIALSPALFLSSAVMVCMLLVMLITVSMNAFSSSRPLGLFLLITYVGVMTCNLVLEIKST